MGPRNDGLAGKRLVLLLAAVGGLSGFAALTAFGSTGSSAGAAENIVFPADAGVVDVTKAPYGAKGDGKTDDTAAIQQALSAFPNGNRIIYLPNGTYLVSGTLKWPESDKSNTCKRTVLQGQSQKGTVLKLKDACPGFTNPAMPQAVIRTGLKPAERFGNGIRTLIIDTGRGNGGAIGVQYIANNQGTMQRVLIRSGDGRGPIGLDMAYTDEIGPCFISEVEVVGFEVGISTRYAYDSMTLEHITLTGQNKYGFYNDGQCVSIRGLVSTNAVPALYNTKGAGVVALVDANLRGGGRAASEPAVVNESVLFARNIRTAGYGLAIRSSGGAGRSEKGPLVAEFVSHPVRSLFPAPQRSLGLPVKETPRVPWDPLEDWANITAFGATPGDAADCTQAIQKAIDAGKPTVYFPNGSFKVDGIVEIRGKVRRLIGTQSHLSGKGRLKFVDGEAPVVVFERVSLGYSGIVVEHAAKRTLVISNTVMDAGYMNTGTGDLFVEDVCGGPWQITRQNVWARQINPENPVTKIVNDGGMLWILGLKTEREGTLIETRNGGKTEVIGGFCYATSKPKTTPMFVNHNSWLSVTIGEACFNNNPFTMLVSETRGSETKTLNRGQTPSRGPGSVIPLYVGYRMGAR